MEIQVTINDASHFLDYNLPHVVRICFTVSGNYDVGRIRHLKSGECVDLVDEIARLFGIQQTSLRIDKIERWVAKFPGKQIEPGAPKNSTKHSRPATAKNQKIKSYTKSIPSSIGDGDVGH